MSDLTPSRPYLLRAYYEWLMDNQLTPHVVVDAFVKNTQVPMQYVKDGQIVLNISSSAVGELTIDNEAVQFNARFGGVPQLVYLPMAAIIAIYARENGAGTVFELEPAYEVSEEEFEESVLESLESQAETEQVQQPKKRAHLTLVK